MPYEIMISESAGLPACLFVFVCDLCYSMLLQVHYVSLAFCVLFGFDFGFFVFRLDIGFKTYDPGYLEGDRWFNDYNFGNAVYNIGINYPF